MHKAMKYVLMVSAVLALPAMALAGGSDRIGTAGGLELVIPTDARGAAMGGSVIAASEGTEAWFWNPAGAATLTGSEVSASHRVYIADIALDHVSLAHNAGSFGVIGLSVKALSMDDEPVYTTQQPEGTGEYFSSSFVVVGLSYARTLTDRVDFGINGHYIAEKIYRETANGVAFDMGFLYRPSVRGMALGVVVKNYGPKMKFDGPDLNVGYDPDPSNPNQDPFSSRIQVDAYDLPLTFRIGMAYDIEFNGDARLMLTAEAKHPNDNLQKGSIGAEFRWQENYFLRAGYKLNYEEEGLSLGGGFTSRLTESTDLAFDYAWVDFGRLASVHRFSAGLHF